MLVEQAFLPIIFSYILSFRRDKGTNGCELLMEPQKQKEPRPPTYELKIWFEICCNSISELLRHLLEIFLSVSRMPKLQEQKPGVYAQFECLATM